VERNAVTSVKTAEAPEGPHPASVHAQTIRAGRGHCPLQEARQRDGSAAGVLLKLTAEFGLDVQGDLRASEFEVDQANRACNTRVKSEESSEAARDGEPLASLCVCPLAGT
jgi:hypothetical protein